MKFKCNLYTVNGLITETNCADRHQKTHFLILFACSSHRAQYSPYSPTKTTVVAEKPVSSTKE